MADAQDDFLQYYERELAYLRRRGAEFAERYPKVAGRLEFGGDPSPDPHVERLLESFAFLTGRIQQRVEGDFPELTSALLGVLYPQLVSPVPSMSVAQFEVDADQGKLTSGYRIPRLTPLYAQTRQGLTCRFRTCYPVTLWPVTVAYAGFEPAQRFDFLDAATDVATVLRLRLSSLADPFEALELDRLRFCLDGDPAQVNTLYELLFTQVRGVAILPEDGGQPVYLPEDAIQPVGFGPEEAALPYPAYAHPAYRLLQEFFTFPAKFNFFDLCGLDAHRSGNGMDLLIMLGQSPRQLGIDRNNFRLGCTPIINLFRQTAEPIRLDHTETEYRLTPDMRRERTTEVHSILSVSASADPEDDTLVFEPYFSYNHRMAANGHKAFWFARRQYTGRKELPGTEMHLSLVDLNFDPADPPVQTVFAHTLCTNRTLAHQLPANCILQVEASAPLNRITCLEKPTPQLTPPLGGQALWRLISQLSLNHLSLSEGAESLLALKEILRLYSFSTRASTEQQIAAIRGMACQRVVRRLGTEAWRGFCRGTEVTLEIDESATGGASAFLFASVLNHFFGLYASINSFTQLVLTSTQREGTWKRWPPMAGDQAVL